MFFVYHSLGLIVFVIVFSVAVLRVSKLRTASATHNTNLLPFACLSLSSWVLWALQYVILLATPFLSRPSDFFLNTGLFLGLTQNVLWATALVFLYSQQYSRIS